MTEYTWMSGHTEYCDRCRKSSKEVTIKYLGYRKLCGMCAGIEVSEMQMGMHKLNKLFIALHESE